MNCCADCRHLKRTSPEQRFLLCGFWSRKPLPVKSIRQIGEFDDSYIVLHCHVQPEAPACPMYEAREVPSAGAA